MKDTKQERVSDTVFFKHKYITQLEVTMKDRIMAAIKELAIAVKEQRNPKGK